MKKKIYSYLIAGTILFAGACKKDIGNYEYHDINKVTISNIGETGVVNAFYGKPLSIKPEVSYTMDDKADPSRYSYEWTYLGPQNRIFVLATTKNLELQNVSLPAGTYTFYYRVTDKETGVQFDQKFSLVVRNEINEGWLLMTDVNGYAQLDMLSLEVDKTFTTINDLLGKTGSGLTLKGKPLMVYAYDTGTLVGPGINLPYGLYIGTDEETNRIDPDTFKWSSIYNVQYEIFGYNFPEKFHVDAIRRSGITRSYMVANGDFLIYDRTTQIKYSTPLNYIGGKSFKIAPFIALNEVNSLVSPVVFDVTNKRFVKHSSYSSATVIAMPDPTTNKLFSYNIGMDLIYMNWVDYNGGEVFSILKNASNQYYLARFKPSNGAQSYYAQITATDFDKAEKIAISPNLGYIFYNVGGKVYEYDMFLKTSKLMLDKGTQKISALKFQVFHNFSKYTDGTKLIVCSYDPALPADKNGKMEMFSVPAVNGDLVLAKTYTGFGKVVSLHYRER